MPRIAQGQENTAEMINWFIRVYGELTDMYEVSFRIFNIEGGLPGSQIFPLSGWEDVTSGGGHYSTGYYFAYDNANACGWTPAVDASIGTHRIEWRWKQFEISDYQTGAEDFELTTAAQGSSYLLYITVDDVRAEGITDPPFSDDLILATIETWQSILERACRQWFYPRNLTLKFDGDNSETAHFGVPIISVEYLKLNEDAAVLSSDLYVVYNRVGLGDRHDPHIALRAYRFLDPSDSLYLMGFRGRPLKFSKGYQNHEIRGTFGYVEPDGTTPPAIKRALLKLVIEKLLNPLYTAPGAIPPGGSGSTYAGVVISESTDGHSITYGTATFDKRKTGLSGLTQDQEILTIIDLYRAPIGIANTSYWSW